MCGNNFVSLSSLYYSSFFFLKKKKENTYKEIDVGEQTNRKLNVFETVSEFSSTKEKKNQDDLIIVNRD